MSLVALGVLMLLVAWLDTSAGVVAALMMLLSNSFRALRSN